MAANLDDGEFWLPPEFLTDDDILMDFKANNGNGKIKGTGAGLFFPYDYASGFAPFGPYSDLSSPVESVVSSPETESDEDDFIAGLTRRMAHSTLHRDLWSSDHGLGCESKKSWAMAGSPQSTLCSVIGGCGCKHGSSRGSPNCHSQLSSPPEVAATLNRNEAALDLLYAAAGEVARMRMIEGGALYYQSRGLSGPSRKPTPVSLPLKNPKPNLGTFHPKQSTLSYQQLQVAQLMLKQQGSTDWGQSKAGGYYPQSHTHQAAQNKTRNSGRPLCLSPSAWPTLQQSQQQQQQQQQPGSGMRAVFLGNTGPKKECAGTGVFLPRRAGSPTETRKKPGCSTVLLPDRVVQALNLNLDAPQPQLQFRFNGAAAPEFGGDGAALIHRNNVLMAQQKRHVRAQTAVGNPDLRLPSDWTY